MHLGVVFLYVALPCCTALCAARVRRLFVPGHSAALPCYVANGAALRRFVASFSSVCLGVVLLYVALPQYVVPLCAFVGPMHVGVAPLSSVVLRCDMCTAVMFRCAALYVLCFWALRCSVLLSLAPLHDVVGSIHLSVAVLCASRCGLCAPMHCSVVLYATPLWSLHCLALLRCETPGAALLHSVLRPPLTPPVGHRDYAC